jgi:hypothetical protein
VQKIEEEHDTVERSLENIKIALRTWMESEDFTLWKIEFIWQMRELKNDLLKHFDFEEDSGFFDHYPKTQSNGGTYGKRMRTEHKQLAKDLQKILNKLKKISDIRNPELKKMEVDILHLIREISKHENREMSVINTLYH